MILSQGKSKPASYGLGQRKSGFDPRRPSVSLLYHGLLITKTIVCPHTHTESEQMALMKKRDLDIEIEKLQV